MKSMKKAVPFYLLNLLVFSIFAVFSNYIVAYFSAKGLLASQIGIITTVGAVITVSLQIFMGSLADKSKNKVRVLQIELIVMIVFTGLAAFSGSFVTMLITFATINFLTTIVVTMSDAITVEESGKIGQSYGKIRLTGSIGYMFCSLLAGIFAENNINSIFIMLAILLVILFIITLFMPNIPGEDKKEDKVSILSVLKEKEIILVFALLFLLGICSNFFMNYAVIFYESIGISLSQMGVLFFLGALFEIPLLFFLDKLINKFGAKNLILTAAVLSLFRWVVMMFVLHPFIGVFSQLMHGFTYTFGMISAVRYINEKLPKKFSATGQMVLSIVANGFSKIISSFFGGYIIDYFGGVAPIIKYLAVIMVVAILGFIVLMPKEKKGAV